VQLCQKRVPDGWSCDVQTSSTELRNQNDVNDWHTDEFPQLWADAENKQSQRQCMMSEKLPSSPGCKIVASWNPARY